MFKQMWKEIPLMFKVIWVGGIAVTLGVIVFAGWVIIKVLQHFNII